MKEATVIGDMEHWIDNDDGRITLAQNDRVLCIQSNADGRFSMIEMCDEYFAAAYAPDELIAALEEAIAWVRTRAQGGVA